LPGFQTRLVQSLAIITASLGLITIFADLSTRPSQNAAAAIENGAKFSPTTATAIVDGSIPTPQSHSCRTDTSRATLSLDFAAIDALVRADQGAKLAGAFAKARNDIAIELACEPKDGNAWLRLALIDNADGAPIEQSLDALRKSQAYTPSEGWILRTRLAFTSAMIQAGIREFEPAFRTDLDILIANGSPIFIADTIAGMPRRPKQAALDKIAASDPDRAAAINTELKKREKAY